MKISKRDRETISNIVCDIMRISYVEKTNHICVKYSPRVDMLMVQVYKGKIGSNPEKTRFDINICLCNINNVIENVQILLEHLVESDILYQNSSPTKRIEKLLKQLGEI